MAALSQYPAVSGAVLGDDLGAFVGPAWRSRRVVMVAGIAGLLYLLTDHDWLISRFEDFSETSEFMGAVTLEGNFVRRAATFALAAISLLALWRSAGYQLRARGLLAVLMSSTALWCIASLAWSIEPSLAARRLVAAGCTGLAALAAAKLINPRELAIAALLCSMGYLLLGIATEIALGTFQPWRADYRLAGTLHPNNQGLNCALLVMAATYLAQFSKKHSQMFWAFAAAGLAALWMTHSRTPLAALFIAESLFWFATTTSRNRIVAGIGAVCLACVALFFAGGEIVERAASAVSMGRGDENELGELTGRVPLWEELSESIARRPIEGYGFSSFWTPRNIEDISDSQYWAISVGHSAYIDLALGIGLVGVILYGSVALWGMIVAVYRHIKLPAAGYGFIGVLLLFALLHGLLESAFANPGFVPLIAMSGLAMLAFVDPRQYVGAAGHDAKPAEMTSIHVLSWRIKSP